MRGATSFELTAGRCPYRAKIVLGRFVVDVRCDDRRVIDAVESSLEPGAVRNTAPGAAGSNLSVRLELTTAPATMRLPLPPRDTAASSFEDVELYGSDGVRILVVGRKSMVRIDRSTGVARGFVAPKHLGSPWIIAHRIVYLALIELLRGRGAHYLHAGCVCHGNVGILICGESGAGKSTLTYALARAGFAFVSDDGVFLERDAGGLRVSALPEKIKMDARSCNFFSELRHLGSVKGKVELAPADTGARSVASAARPVVVLFPVRSSGAVSVIAPVPAHDAFARLLGQSIPSLGSSDVGEQMEIIHDLVGACSCYQLQAARDFDAIPELVARTVEVRPC